MAHAFREKRGVFRLPVAAGTPSVAGVVSLVELGRDKRVVLELWPGFRMLTKSSAPMCIFLLRGELAAGSFYRVRNAERASKRAIARRSSELLPARGTSHWSLRRMPDAVRAATARAMRPSWRRCAVRRSSTPAPVARMQ